MDDFTKAHRLFLQGHNNINVEPPIVEPPIAKPPIDSLKLLMVSNLFKDADAEHLIQLRNYIDYELRNRGTDVKVALSLYKNRFYANGTSSVVYEEILRLIVVEFLSINYTKLKHSTYLLDRLYGMLMTDLYHLGKVSTYYDTKITIDADKLQADCQLKVDELLTMYEHLMSLYDDIEEYHEDIVDDIEGYYNMINIGLEDNCSIPGLETNKAQTYFKYFWPDFTNPYIISAIEKLHNKNISTHGMLIMTIRVPANKQIKQCHDNIFGDYVEFVDF